MNNTFNDVSDDLVIFNKITNDRLWKLGPDAYALYGFYYKTAKWQKTNRPRATNEYVMKSLSWGDKKLFKTKKMLLEEGLISTVRIRDNEANFKGFYVQVNYLVPESKTGTIDERIRTDLNSEDPELEAFATVMLNDVSAKLEKHGLTVSSFDRVCESGTYACKLITKMLKDWYLKNKKKKSNLSEEKNPPISKSKKQKETEKFMQIAERVMQKYNQLKGTKRSYKTKSISQPILARLREGYTEEQLIYVVENYRATWEGNEFREQHYVPETIFRASNFDKYLNMPDKRITLTNVYLSIPEQPPINSGLWLEWYKGLNNMQKAYLLLVQEFEEDITSTFPKSESEIEATRRMAIMLEMQPK